MKKRSEHQTEYWQSYSDMMAALLLIFILIIAVAFVQVQKQQKEMEEKEKLLAVQGEEYLVLKKELEENQNKLNKKEEDLNTKEAELEEIENKLKDAEAQLEKVVGVKADLIQDLQNEFGKKGLEIRVDEKTGAICFQSDILFDKNKYLLKERGKKYMEDAIPLYLQVLLSDKYFDYVAEIVVEGNCDSDGTYEYNLKLSQDRARVVAEFCISEMDKIFSDKKMEELLKLMNVNGRSNKNLVVTEKGEDMQASRRVEVKFRLKDEEMIAIITDLLEEMKNDGE